MILRDLNDPKFVAELSPEAEWKRSLIIEFGHRFNLRTLVETGTSLGDTVYSVKPYFEDIHSIELSDENFSYASKRFAGERGVHLYHGSSGKILDKVLQSIPPGRILFWLDAHKTGGPSGDDGNQTDSELEIILKNRPDSLVLIDDVKPFEGRYYAPDGVISEPPYWKCKFLHGVLILHNGSYTIPEKF